MKPLVARWIGFIALLCAMGFGAGCSKLIGLEDVPPATDIPGAPSTGASSGSTSGQGSGVGGALGTGSAGGDLGTSVGVGGSGGSSISGTAGDGGAPAGTGGTSRDASAGSGGQPGDAGADSEAGTCSGLTCDGGCVMNDVHNCGACGHDCTTLPHVSGPVTCNSGQCSFPLSSCAAPWSHCSSSPDQGCEVDISKPNNCGGCGNTCPSGMPVCSSLVTAFSCAAGCSGSTPTLCSGTCVDTMNNPNNCDTCGHACTTNVVHAQPTCQNGACTFSCNAGYTSCGGACIDEQTDNNNCGGCGSQFACTNGRTCQAGRCGCPVATHDCSGNCSSNTSSASCGLTSCSPCPIPPNGSASCDGTSCGIRCTSPYTACGSTCIDLQTDDNNCGNCGSQYACTGGAHCTSGTCQTSPAVLQFQIGAGSPNPPNPDPYTLSSFHTYTLKNIGNIDSSAIAISLTGANPTLWAFISNGNHCTSALPAGSSCTVDVGFSASMDGTSAGDYSATIQASATLGGIATNAMTGRAIYFLQHTVDDDLFPFSTMLSACSSLGTIGNPCSPRNQSGIDCYTGTTIAGGTQWHYGSVRPTSNCTGAAQLYELDNNGPGVGTAFFQPCSGANGILYSSNPATGNLYRSRQPVYGPGLTAGTCWTGAPSPPFWGGRDFQTANTPFASCNVSDVYLHTVYRCY